MKDDENLWVGKVSEVEDPTEQVLIQDVIIDAHEWTSGHSGNTYRTNHIQLRIFDANTSYVDGHAKLRKWSSTSFKYNRQWW